MNVMQRWTCAVAVCVLSGPQLGGATVERDALARTVVSGYATHVAEEYSAALAAAEVMRAAIRAFCASPSDASLVRARETWTAAREIYGRTEVFRFGNGPIDTRRGGVETYLNAWPVDEAYIDAVEGSESAGIIGNPAKYPALGRAILRLHNQRGGETNVCTGWHAIEFMLWGQDRSETGPGERPPSDFIDGKRAFADRRREYLLEITDLLCEDLATLVAAWRKDESNHRRRFEADPPAALRSMLTGTALLTGFEMAGERLAVAYETRDQEEEHSCFSDTTHIDFRANIRGVDAVLRGRGGPGLLDVVRAADAERATSVETSLGAAVAAVDAMPIPFDSAIRAKDGSPERAALKAAVDALETLGEELGRAGQSARLVTSDGAARLTPIVIIALILAAATSLGAARDGAQLGGPATVDAHGPNAFGLPAPGLTREERRAFSVGNSFFRDNWVVAPASAAGRDGLGPLFNANSCSACHQDDGRGRPPTSRDDVGMGMVVFVSPHDADGAPHPIYGAQLQDQAVPGVRAEVEISVAPEFIHGMYADGSPYELRRWTLDFAEEGYGPLGRVRTSMRLGQQLIGVGLIEAVDDAALLALEDPEDRDADGISGRAHRRIAADGTNHIGRFGWKASQPTLEAQVVAALHGDMGITSDRRPDESLTAAQRAMVSAPAGGGPEIDQHKIERIAHYCRVLAVPRQRGAGTAIVERGRKIFADAQCAACHVPALQTGDASPIAHFRRVTIRPYTDMLLHDMGDGLADHRSDGDATGSEWRTPPLWGIGLLEVVNGHAHFLHDGRARSLEEAILWHGGEAQRSRDAFVEMPADDRAALVAFLHSL